jgi:hypothetical protein
MKASQLQFDNYRGYLLERVTEGDRGERFYKCTNLSIFSIWKHEILSKLGDVEIREDKPDKNSLFRLLINKK